MSDDRQWHRPLVRPRLVSIEAAAAEIEPAARPEPQHPALLYVAGLAPGSRRTMVRALDVVAGILTGGEAGFVELDWAELGPLQTGAVRAVLAERYAPATARRMLAALRGVLRAAWRLGLMPTERYQRAIDLEPVRGATTPAGRALDAGELRALFRVCAEARHPTTGTRDAALLALLYGGGLRRAEAVALDVGDVDPETGEVRIRDGKGRRDRTAWLPEGGRRALRAWLAHRGETEGALLCPVDKAGNITIRRVTGQAVLYRLRRLAELAGVGGFSPHDLRRTFIGDLLDAGADLAAVQQLAGHASPATTSRYDRRGERVKREAAERLSVPFWE